MPFKKGAFIGGKPVSMVLIEWDNTYRDPSDASCSILTCLKPALTGIRTRVIVHYLGDYIPSPEEAQDPSLYANNVRKTYSQLTGWPMVEYTLKDKFYFYGINTDGYESTSQLFKDTLGEQCTRQNGYYVDATAIKKLLME